MSSRLKEKYEKEIVPHLKKKLGCKSVMQAPKLLAIHLNQGIAEMKSDPKIMQAALDEMEQITGQRPVATAAKRSISNFSLRAGMKVGLRVTLRRNRMYEFLDRLFHFTLSNIRDFKGISEKSFDRQGNYNFGIKEQVIFPELTIDKISKMRGMNVTFVFSTNDARESYELLKLFGAPFKNMHETK
jgi:large subunit ribosomal protein L5